MLSSKSVSSLPILPAETLDPSVGTNTEASTVPTGPVEILHVLDFVPRMFMQHVGQNFLEFPSFDEAVDEYYCKVRIRSTLTSLLFDCIAHLVFSTIDYTLLM